MVPLAPGRLVRDLAMKLRLPLVIAARPGLGTINHALLTVEAARAVGMRIAGIVLTPWPDRPGPVESSNRGTLAALTGIPVEVLPRTAPDRRSLAHAGAGLPLAGWLNHGSLARAA
jgi:dethiobiotin synthetase